MAITLSVGGVNLVPYIAFGGYSWSKNDVDSSDAGRTLDGVLHRNRIATKIKLEITTKPLTTAELHLVLRAIQPEFVDVSYTDPLVGTVQTKTMYSNNIPVQVAIQREDGTVIWNGFKFPLIEK